MPMALWVFALKQLHVITVAYNYKRGITLCGALGGGIWHGVFQVTSCRTNELPMIDVDFSSLLFSLLVV
jgi:hypothetical protein